MLKLNRKNILYFKFLRKFKIKNSQKLTNQICSFGYEKTQNNNFTILLPNNNEYVYGPITLAYLFTKYKQYNEIPKINIDNYTLKLKKNIIQVTEYIEEEIDIHNFMIQEFGSTVIPDYLLDILIFFNKNIMDSKIKKTNKKYQSSNSITRRLLLTFTKNSNISINTNALIPQYTIEEYLINYGYKELCLHPILKNNYNDNINIVNNTQNNIINPFISRKFLRKYLFQAYFEDFDACYFQYNSVFSVDEVYNVNDKENNINIFIATKYISQKIFYLDIIKNMLLFFGKKSDFYIEQNLNVVNNSINNSSINNSSININNIYIKKDKIGICSIYKERIFIELFKKHINNIKNNKITNVTYDYNIICKEIELNLIIKNICLNCEYINSYSIVDIYIDKNYQKTKLKKYTIRIYLDKKIEYQEIEKLLFIFNSLKI